MSTTAIASVGNVVYTAEGLNTGYLNLVVI